MIYLYKSLVQTCVKPTNLNFLFKATTAARSYSTLVRPGPGLIANTQRPLQLNVLFRRFGTKKSTNSQANTAAPKPKKIHINELKRLLSLAKPHKLKISRKFLLVEGRGF